MSTNNYYEKYWNSQKSHDGHAAGVPNWPIAELDMFYRSISHFVGKKVLDVGSGEGIFLNYLITKKKLHKAVGLELSTIAIEKAKKINSKIEYVCGSADDDYPFDKNSFDTVFLTDVIEHLVDIDKTISEIKRILKPNGNVIIITPDFNFLKRIIIAAFFWDRFFYPSNPHIRFFTRKSMDHIMKVNLFNRIYYRWGITWFNLMPQNSYFVYKNNK
ncbi:MAG: class I SAM-dependent methyltransferase [Minisyncoccia bacterium]